MFLCVSQILFYFPTPSYKADRGPIQVWTTNIPVNIEPGVDKKGDNKWLAKPWVKKLGWTIVTLVLPEVPLVLAVFEKKTAKMLREEIRKLPDFGKKWDPDLTVSYFATMGGFCVKEVTNEGGLEQDRIAGSQAVTGAEEMHSAPELTSKEVCQSPQDPDWEDGRRTLSAHGLLILYQQEPDLRNTISSEDIKNLSKGAPGFEKWVVITQASWMALQVAWRAISGLPVTALEIHTVAHVICGLSMYFM